MSTVKIEQLKAWCRVTHDLDDTLLQITLDGAEDEALMFLDREQLPRRGNSAVDECVSGEFVSDSGDLSPTVRDAILLLAQGMYEGKDAAEMGAVRIVAQTKLFPYRNRLGV